MPQDRAQVVTELELAIRYLEFRCPAPRGFLYEIVWREHELGEYADICLVWEDECRAPPPHLIERAERAIQAFDEAVDWSAIWEEDDEDEQEIEDEEEVKGVATDSDLASEPYEDREFEKHLADRFTGLRQNLRLKVGYDEEKIDKLIAMEREGSTEEELMQAAIERWERDNR